MTKSIKNERDRKNKPIAVADFETDPFKENTVIYPFACELLISEKEYHQYWGDKPVEWLVNIIKNLQKQYIIYFHNGGRFDFFLKDENSKCLLHYFDSKIKIVNRRIISANIGYQEIRDSFAIFPESLSNFKGRFTKKEIDYSKLDKKVREKYKEEILEYQHYDCLTLYEHCIAFQKEFGEHLTIGSCATKELRKYHSFENFTGNDKEERDAKCREFFFGGRTQCFKSGIIKGNYKIFDVNGMYQKVMRDYMHPIGQHYTVGNKVNNRTDFIVIEAINYGALPLRTKTGIDFNIEKGIFKTTIHEMIAGEETNTLKIMKIIETYSCRKHEKFDDFINHFYESRIRMKEIGNEMRDAFYKRIMNASYGRMAMNPRLYKDYIITEKMCPGSSWKENSRYQDWIIWEKESNEQQYLNIGTAASITGAGRAILLHGLKNSVDPVYCDTDSIICKDLRNIEIDPVKLGCWKIEGRKSPNGNFIYETDNIAIAGKKLYSIFGNDNGKEFPMKIACKGAKLTSEQIRDIASGKSAYIEWSSPVPKFDFVGNQSFIKRNIKMTAK